MRQIKRVVQRIFCGKFKYGCQRLRGGRLAARAGVVRANSGEKEDGEKGEMRRRSGEKEKMRKRSWEKEDMSEVPNAKKRRHHLLIIHRIIVSGAVIII